MSLLNSKRIRRNILMTVVRLETFPNSEENANATASKSAGNSQPYNMTEEILLNRRFTIERGRWITQLYALTIACISSISQGTVLGWSAPAVNTITEEISAENILTSKNFAFISSLAPLGCSLGVVVWTYCNITVGPRKTMLFQAPFLFTTWIGLSLVQKAELAYAGRFFSGFFSISYMICGETLLQDCVHKGNLRYMMMAFRTGVFVGILLSYIIGFLWADKLYFTCLSAIVVGIHFVLLIFVPESPVFLYEKNPKQAEKSLTWYRGKGNLVLEMREIKRDSEIRNLEPSSFKYMLLAKVVIKGILIVIGMATFQIMSGYYLIMFYNLIICKGSSKKLTTKNIIVISKFGDALIIGITFLVSKIIAIQVHYSVPYGVKKPILLSGLCTGICLVVIGAYNTIREVYPNIIKSHWINLVGAIGIIVSYELGFGEYPAMMLFHYMPYQVYYRAKLTMAFTHWFLCFLFTQFFIELQEAIHYSNILLIVMGLCCFLSMYYANTFIVDFKNQTLVQIQLQLGGNPIGSRGGYRRGHSETM